MMLAPLLLAVLAARVTEAPTIPWRAKYDAAFSEAAARNVPVLIVDFDGWTEDRGQSQPDAFYSDKAFLAELEFAVVLLASQHDHGTRRQTIDGEERDVCPAWGGVSCDAHRDLLPKLFADFGKDGELISPLFVVASPERKQLARMEHERRPAELVVALKDAAKRLGPGMSATHHRQLTEGLARLKRLIELHEHAAATALLETLKKVPGNFAPNAAVKATETELDAAGQAQAKRAEELWAAARHREALERLDDVKAAFGKLPCAGVASASLVAKEKDAAAKPHLAALKAHRGARQIYFQAVSLEQAGDRRRALDAVEKLLRQFPESAFTDRAMSLRAGLKAGGS
jgi:hypothetical protein